MFRFLYVADLASTLLDDAVDPATFAHSRGWRTDAMARGVSACESCSSAFGGVFEPPWAVNPLDPRNFGVASWRFREFVERGEYDVVHIVSPTVSWLARHALSPLRGLMFPRVIVSSAPGPAGLLDRLAMRAVGEVIASPAAWDAVYARALDVVEPVVGGRGQRRPAIRQPRALLHA